MDGWINGKARLFGTSIPYNIFINTDSCSKKGNEQIHSILHGRDCPGSGPFNHLSVDRCQSLLLKKMLLHDFYALSYLIHQSFQEPCLIFDISVEE